MEEPLPAGGSCLLGSLNLSAFVEEGRFDYNEFKRAIGIAVVALNKVLDEGMNKHPLIEQRKNVKDWRQIGLGIMGLADMLIKMGIRYGSQESIEVCHKIGYILSCSAIYASSELAKEHGAYPEYNDKVLESEFFLSRESDALLASVECYGLRNSQLLTIAPTGTLSTMLGISGGIEPIFANSYNRMTKSLHGEDVEYKVYTPIVAEYMEEHELKDESELPPYFVTASDLTIEERIDMQSIWQSHIDASISSTVNLPESATVEDVKNLYMMAWLSGLKGVTVYRAGCKRDGILTETKKDDKEIIKPKVPKANAKTTGLERHLTTGCGSLHVCAYFDENGNLNNTYLSKGSSGGCNNYMIGLSRTMSLAARNGVPIEEIVDQLKSCGTCPSYAVRSAIEKDTSKGSCCPAAVGNALMEMWKEFNEHITITKTTVTNPCPVCGEELVAKGGCIDCVACGWSKCNL